MFDVDIQDGVPPLKLPFNITGKVLLFREKQITVLHFKSKMFLDRSNFHTGTYVLLDLIAVLLF